MNIIGVCYATCCLLTQTVAHSLPGFQGIKRCVKYLDSHPHKIIFYRSISYDGSNVVSLTWSGNQIEDYTTHNCLECHQYADHARILNRRRSVSGIIHTMFGVSVYWKVQIQTAISSDSTDGEIRCMYKATNKKGYMEICLSLITPHCCTNSTFRIQKSFISAFEAKRVTLELNRVTFLSFS